MAATVNYGEYMKTCDALVKEITRVCENNKQLRVTLERLEMNLRHQLAEDHKIWALPVATSYVEVCKMPTSEEDLRLSYVLGWLWKMMLAFLNDVDDFVDQDEARYGKPTWCSLNERRPIVMNDAFLFEQTIFQLLRKCFGQHPCYLDLVNYFQDVIFKYMIGNSLGLQTTKKENPEMDRFTWDAYRAIYDGIANVYLVGIFELPLILAGYPKECELRKRVQDIVRDLATFWRVRDDVNDSFGKDKRNPLRHRDIKNGECCWPILKAKELASPGQWKDLMRAYGMDNEKDAALVISIFEELGIPEIGKRGVSSVKNKLDEAIELLIRDGHQVGNSIRHVVESLSISDEC